jgi:beta-glucanase (GH16 family)
MAADGVSETEDARTVQNWSLWEPLSSFNTNVWNKADWTNGGMFNCGWKPDHAYFSGDGKLVLKLDNTSSHGRPYTSAEYRTNNTFTYGTFETNMKAAKGNGMVSSFFLYTGSPWDEIDVEILGKNTNQVQFNYYVNGVGNNEKVINLGFDASQGYHRYAIEYGNGYINWYVDGAWKYGVNNTGFNASYGKQMPSHPMQIIMNLWPGTGVDSWLGYFSYAGAKYAFYDYVKYTPK